jgi:hypothetical protein
MSNLHVGGKQRLFLCALEDKETLGLFDNALVQGQNYFREAWEDFPSCLAAGAAGGDISNLGSIRAVAPDSRGQAPRRLTNDQIGVRG